MRPATGGDSATRTCAHIKRFLELLEGDPDVRARVAGGAVLRPQVLADAGLDLPADEMDVFWPLPDIGRRPPAEQQAWRQAFESSRLGRMWIDWSQAQEERQSRALRERVPSDPRARAWRARRLARVRSEAIRVTDLGYFPLLTFELTEGCSVQCWFCALDPERLKGVFAYTPENRALWRDVLGHAWDLLGPGCRNAMCYHGTDPTDNPDFFRFQEDLVEAFGVLPQVTTAQPLRDVAWTRTLLEWQRRFPDSHHRFSILSLGTLRRVHQTFTPEDLLDVGLVMQHKEALGRRVECGRAAARQDRLEAEARYRASMNVPEDIHRQTTCECTCGYLVNMVTRQIKLISPATPSADAPLGYATHAEGTFDTGAGFHAFLEQTMAEHMPLHLPPGRRLRFWDDLRYERLPDGFRVTSRFRTQAARGTPHLGLLGDLIHAGTRTTAEVSDALIRAGMPVLDASGWLDRVYQTGVIAEP